MVSLLDFLCIGGQPQQVINSGSRVFLFLHWLLLRREKVSVISVVLSLLTSRNKPPQNCWADLWTRHELRAEMGGGCRQQLPAWDSLSGQISRGWMEEERASGGEDDVGQAVLQQLSVTCWKESSHPHTLHEGWPPDLCWLEHIRVCDAYPCWQTRVCSCHL